MKDKKLFPSPSAVPAIEVANGIFADFNAGARVYISDDAPDMEYTVNFFDEKQHWLASSQRLRRGQMAVSSVKYSIDWRVTVFDAMMKPIADFRVPRDAATLICIPDGALGDTIAWVPMAERYRLKYSLQKIAVSGPGWMKDVFGRQYPEIAFLTVAEAERLEPTITYRVGINRGDEEYLFSPYDYRLRNLQQCVADQLGLDWHGCIPPALDLSAQRKIKEKYAVIAAKSSFHCKQWQNPYGWPAVVEWLEQEKGMRVLCIDKNKIQGTGFCWDVIPYGAEDFTGDRPLQERIDLIKDAEVFIGLSSGLSWLAWTCGVPVVMVSGFSEDFSEFYTPYRIQNLHVCHGCWNDSTCAVDSSDYGWCPRHKGTERAFECTRAISPESVIDCLKKILK